MKKGGAQLRVGKFYGDDSRGRTNKHWEEKRIKLEKCAIEFSRNPIPSSRKLRIDDPLPVFQLFPRQQMAFEFMKTCKEDVHVFAKEKDCSGKRGYIVSTLPEFWHIYRRQFPEERRYYEVIPEGAACKLYFDLEFKRVYNTEKDGAKMVDIFIKYVCYHLQDMYGINCNRKFIIDLDSSTSTKFSRHLIFHLSEAVFKDNINAGNFVHHICTLLERKLGTGGETFIEDNTTESSHYLCDTQESSLQSSYYGNSNSKCMREEIPGICKHINKDGTITGKGCDTSSIETSGNLKRVVPEEKEISYRGNIKEESFTSISLAELRELLIEDGNGGLGIFCDRGVYTKNRNFRILRSTKIGKNAHLVPSKQNTYKPSFKNRKGSFSTDAEYLFFIDSLVSNVSMQVGGKDVVILTCESCTKTPKQSACQAGPLESSQPSLVQLGQEFSPYPEIDQFVSQIIDTGGVRGEIRRWVFFPQGKLLTYDILKNRWCENIGRPHKSNHVMIVVDLRIGVYYQKCHDPECRKVDYRSPERPIPEEINPLSGAQTVDLSIEYELDDDDQELCRLAAECEELAYTLREKDYLVPCTETVSFAKDRNIDEKCVTRRGDLTIANDVTCVDDVTCGDDVTSGVVITGSDVDWDDIDCDDQALLDTELSYAREIKQGKKSPELTKLSRKQALCSCDYGSREIVTLTEEGCDVNAQALSFAGRRHETREEAIHLLGINGKRTKEETTDLDDCFRNQSEVLDGIASQSVAGECKNVFENHSNQGKKNKGFDENKANDKEHLATIKVCCSSYPDREGEDISNEHGTTSQEGTWVSSSSDCVCEWLDAADSITDAELLFAVDNVESLSAYRSS